MPLLVLYYLPSGEYLDRVQIHPSMNINPGQEEKWQALRRHLSHIWVVWGLFPLGIMFVLMLALASPQASANTSTTDQQESLRTERRAQAVLAVSALLFFVGFTLDGRWTDAERVGRRILRAGVSPRGAFPFQAMISSPRAHNWPRTLTWPSTP